MDTVTSGFDKCTICREKLKHPSTYAEIYPGDFIIHPLRAVKTWIPMLPNYQEDRFKEPIERGLQDLRPAVSSSRLALTEMLLIMDMAHFGVWAGPALAGLRRPLLEAFAGFNGDWTALGNTMRDLRIAFRSEHRDYPIEQISHHA